MPSLIPTRIATVVGSVLLLSVMRGAAQNLPATPPTQALQPGTAPLSATPTQLNAATRAHHAEVRYDSGLLSVNANNSSLNQILRDISKATGMKITGGVREERVFGHYGPAATGDILATLIDGTGTNMLLRQDADAAPAELVLTPRNGGASPPNPNAQSFDGGDDDAQTVPRPPQSVTTIQNQPQPSAQQSAPLSGPPSVAPPANNINGSSLNVTPTASQLPTTNSVSIDAISTPSTTPSSTGIVDTPNPPDAGTVNPTATTPANGVKTPQQIYEQLQQMRQQQQKTPQ